MRFSKANDIKLPEMSFTGRDDAEQTPERLCEAPNCDSHGDFPAPKNREALRDYRYFCLQHVREYNKRWNYFSGMEGAALEQAIRDASTWERPSWKFGTSGAKGADKTDQEAFEAGKQPPHARHSYRPEDLEDLFGFFDDDITSTKDAVQEAMDPEERKAWALFGIDPTTDMSLLKKRYNVLVKEHHPDRHNGDPKAEEKLKEINLAYSLLRKKHAKQ